VVIDVLVVADASVVPALRESAHAPGLDDSCHPGRVGLSPPIGVPRHFRPLRPGGEPDAMTPKTWSPPNSRRRLERILLAAITTPLLMTGLASPAQAQPVGASAGGAVTGVPDCVLTVVDDDGSSDYVVVTNGCRRTVRIQVVLDDYPDPDCITIPETESRSVDWFYPGRYDGLTTC
jgi:hypothetical protein